METNNRDPRKGRTTAGTGKPTPGKRIDEYVRKELPLIERIIRNEVWHESERRGYPVSPRDPSVQTRVADVILQDAGAWMRRMVSTRCSTESNENL